MGGLLAGGVTVAIAIARLAEDASVVVGHHSDLAARRGEVRSALRRSAPGLGGRVDYTALRQKIEDAGRAQPGWVGWGGHPWKTVLARPWLIASGDSQGFPGVQGDTGPS